jgi:hypothetical protein
MRAVDPRDEEAPASDERDSSEFATLPVPRSEIPTADELDSIPVEHSLPPGDSVPPAERITDTGAPPFMRLRESLQRVARHRIEKEPTSGERTATEPTATERVEVPMARPRVALAVAALLLLGLVAWIAVRALHGDASRMRTGWQRLQILELPQDHPHRSGWSPSLAPSAPGSYPGTSGASAPPRTDYGF